MTDEEIMTIANDIERNKEIDLIAFARAIAAKQREIDAALVDKITDAAFDDYRCVDGYVLSAAIRSQK